ncbi:hypothetical protein ACJMK2_017946 [Sinanodonta woodiana]|uniref:Uncharacterized protein n=1 Tax=Sinanodonta woodiana TaxID=1069815 RepID=A0ABD3UFS9_SINWO
MLFPPASPLSALASTGVVVSVQGIALLSILTVIFQELLNKRKQQRTCQEPPSSIGNFVLVGKQGDAAFYDCPGQAIVQHYFTQTCPIIYCQENGNYSAPAFEVAPSMCVYRKSVAWFKGDEATVIGLDFTCNKPCAMIILFQGTGLGGRGFKISFTSDV